MAVTMLTESTYIAAHVLGILHYMKWNFAKLHPYNLALYYNVYAHSLWSIAHYLRMSRSPRPLAKLDRPS